MSTQDSPPPDDTSKEAEDSNRRRIDSYEEKVRRYDRG